MTIGLPPVSNIGFELFGKKASVLLLHGYTGSPYDLRPVGNFLHYHDFYVRAPLLKGHGTEPKDLYGVTAQDWLEQAKAALSGLDPDRPIVVGGLSMGALLAILLAKENHNIRALLLFSPAIKLNLTGELVLLGAQFGLLEKASSLKKISGGSDILDPVAKKKCPSYQELPIGGLLEFDKLRILANEALSKLVCPIFLAFGEKDSSIDVHQSHRIILENTQTPVYCKLYKNSKHVVTLDYDRKKLLVDVMEFLTNCL